MSNLRRLSLVSLRVVLCCVCAIFYCSEARAQNIDMGYGSATNAFSVGTNTFGQVMRVVGLNSVIGASGGGSSPISVDSNGDIWKDPTTFINTIAEWSHTTKVSFGGGLNVTVGPISGGSGTMNPLFKDNVGDVRRDAGSSITTSGHWNFTNPLDGRFVVAGSTNGDTALGFDNVRIHENGGSPRLTWEDASFLQWTIDNLNGAMRFYRTSSAGTADQVPLQLFDYIVFDPKAKAILPARPYDISIGSPLDKFLAIYAAELNVETLVRQNIMATMGGRILVLPTTTLRADITSSTTSITTNENNIIVGDIVYMEGDGRVEFMSVSAGPVRLNRCIIASSCATADTVTNWNQAGGGALTLDRDHRYQGDASVVVSNTASFAYWSDGTTWLVNSTTYTVQLVIRRSDDGPIVPVTSSAYDLFCGSTDQATSTTADDLGVNGAGHHWYRLHGVCNRTTSSNFVGVTNLPTGGVTHNLDAMQIELGSTMTTWSQTASSYTVTRNLDGSGGNSWIAGTAVANTGQTGNGFIDIYSTRGVRAGTEIGPALCGNVRQSSTYNDWAARWCVGQLQGVYGFGSSTFGIAAGNPTGIHFDITDAGGVRFMNNTTVQADFVSAGITIGNHVANTPVMLLTSTALQFCIYGGACTFTVDGTTGNMRGGSATGLSTGTGYFIGGSGTARFGDPASDYWKWDGTNLTVQSSNLTVGSGGTLMFPGSSCCSDLNAYGFKRQSGNNVYFGTTAWDSGTISQVAVWNVLNNTAKASEVSIGAGNDGTVRNVIHVQSGTTFGGDLITITVAAGGSLKFNGNAGLTTTVVVPCGTLTFTLGALTNKGAC